MQYWTEDEARAYLPRLRLLLQVIQRASHLAVHASGNGHATMPGPRPSRSDGSGASDSPVGSPRDAGSPPGEPGERGEPDGPAAGEGADEKPVTFDAADALRELDEKGIVLRDPARGLIDFPSRHPDGRDVLLCWQVGEDELAWWHLPEDGFAGRRPLPLPPEI